MLRLFGTVGLVVLSSAVLALATDTLFFRLFTLFSGAVLVAVYVWLLRSLPPRSGALRIKGLREAVEVYRDDRGVPHIYARSLHDLYLAQGYVTAQDRLWAMDVNRRTASGRLAEVLGEQALTLDKHYRTLGLRSAAEASFQRYSPAVRAHLQAYADGVNARLAEGRLSPEFTLLRYTPEPWTAADTLLLGKYLAYDLSGNWDTELFRIQLVQTVGAEKASELFWERPNLEALAELEEIPIPDLDNLMSVAARRLNAATGSTAWAVAGSRTRSGAPLLASDPHMMVRMPSPWYQAHLTGPDGLDVIGVSFPGIPGILLGQNREIAWGFTNAMADVQDVYIERLHPERPDEYLVNDQWAKAEARMEEITVRGVGIVHHEVMVTRHGPVIARGDQTALALRWTGLAPTREFEAFLQVNACHSWAEFRRALEQYDGPPQTFVIAARDGTVANKTAGHLPVRSQGAGDTPLPGWSDQFEWVSMVPYADLPESVNPPEGYVVIASEAPSYKATRVKERLRGGADFTSAKLLELQGDRTNTQARALVQLLLHAVQEGLRQGVQPEALSNLEKKALMLLSGWDCVEDVGAPAPTLWHQWYLFLMEGIFRPQMGLRLFDQFIASGQSVQVMDRLVQTVAEGGESCWLGREGEEGFNRIALRAFRRSVALVAAKQGRSPERWRWDREHKLRLTHPVSQRFPALRWILDIGSFAVGGSAQTLWTQGFDPLNPFAVRVQAPWRQVVDMAAADSCQEVSSPGQSGHPMSPWYSDQVAPWLRGEALPRLFKHETIRKLPRLLLQPAGDK